MFYKCNKNNNTNNNEYNKKFHIRNKTNRTNNKKKITALNVKKIRKLHSSNSYRSSNNYNNNNNNNKNNSSSNSNSNSNSHICSYSYSISSKKTLLVVTTQLLLLILINISCVACARERLIKTNLEAKVGSHVAFNCHIDFPYNNPIPYVIHWSKDNKKIFTWYEKETFTNELFTGRLKLVSNSHTEYGRASVNLTAIRESDAGWYHCQIIFPNRTPSIRNNGTWYHLTVQGGSLIKIPPVNQTIMEGQTAFFHCVMKYPEISKATWYKDGVPLKDIQNIIQRSYMGPDGSLSIDPTMMSDLGEYECNVHNDVEEIQTAKAFLNIQYKAKVIYAPPEVYLPYGQSAVLDCHFRANPPLKNLRWEKDGLLFDSYNVPGVYYKMNGSLYFSKVDENHAGSYTCTPYNDLGTDGPSPIISVIVLRPPIFTVTPKAIYIQKLGDTTTMPCEAIDRDGNNRPSIVWSRKDGTPIASERHTINGGNLTIEGLIETDRGIYECSATNEAATITSETELMIENIAPRPPYNLSANSTDTSITIHWQPGYLRPNLEYTVWYRLTEAPEWRTMRILPKDMKDPTSSYIMSATIHQLLPGREYEFMVLSQDKYGDGMFSKQFRYATQPSETKTQETLDGQSSGAEDQEQMAHGTNSLSSSMSPPWNLSAINNQQGWLLHWEHPKRGLANLRLYTVRWWKQPEHFLVGTVETFDNFYQLRHLKEDSTFKIQVTATTIDGTLVSSDHLIVEVPSHRKVRALIIGTAVGVTFLLCALCAFLYVKRSCLMHLFTGDPEVEDGSSEDVKTTVKINNT